MAENGFKETEIGLIPSDWDVKAIGEAIDVIRGVSWNNGEVASSGIAVLTIPNIQDGRITYDTNIYLTKKINEEKILKKSDTIAVASSGSIKNIGRSAFFDGKVSSNFSVASFLLILRPKNEINDLFLYYFSKSELLKLSNFGRRAADGKFNLQVNEFRKSILPLPSKFEQQKIAFVLSMLQQAITQQEQIIAKTKELKRSLMHRLFTYGLQGEEQKETDAGIMPINWDVVPLGNICTYTTGKLNSNAAKENGQYPFFTCSQETYKIDSYSFDQEALLLAGNNARAIYSVKYYKGKFDAYQRTYVFTIMEKKKCSYPYLLYELTRKLEMLRISSLGTTTKYITAGIISNLQIALPKLDEQEEIATALQAIDEKINFEVNRKNYLNNLFKTLLQLLMTGQVRVKDIDFGGVINER